MSQGLTAMACLLRHLKEARNAYDTQHKLHTFSVGLPNSPDLVAARKVSACNTLTCARVHQVSPSSC